MTTPKAERDVPVAADHGKTDAVGQGDIRVLLLKDISPVTNTVEPSSDVRASKVSGTIGSGLRIKEPDTGVDKTYSVKDGTLSITQRSGADESQITFDRNGDPSKYTKNDLPISKEFWPSEVSNLKANLEYGKAFDQKTKTLTGPEEVQAVNVTDTFNSMRSLYLNDAGELTQKRDLDYAKNTGFHSIYELEERGGKKDLRESERLLINPDGNPHEQETDKFDWNGKIESKSIAIHTRDGLTSTQSYEDQYAKHKDLELTEQTFDTPSGYQSKLGLDGFGTTMRINDSKTGIEQFVTRDDKGGIQDEFDDHNGGVRMSLSSALDKNVKGSQLHIGGPHFNYYREFDGSTKLFIDGKQIKPEEQASKLKELTGFASKPSADGGEEQTFKVGGNEFKFDFDKSGALTHHEIKTADGLTSTLDRDPNTDAVIKMMQRYKDGHREQAVTLGADQTGSSNLREWPDGKSLYSADFWRDSKDKQPLLVISTPNDKYDSRFP